MKLKEPKGVVFNELEHTYTNAKGKSLSGVTGLLGRQLFKDKYDGISKSIMEKAAERGNLIHRQIEMYETFGGENLADEVGAYAKLKEQNEYDTLATELLVSDCMNVASSIDVVFEKKIKDVSEDTFLSEIYLCDIKTTSKLDMEYLSWQLSIYKYLLLIHNKKAKVAGLVACWLPREQYGRPKMAVVPEKPMEWVKELIDADSRGEQWISPEIAETSQELAVPQELTQAIANVLKAEKLAKECKDRLRLLMEENGITKWENEDFVATISKATTSTTFDSKALQKDDKELYEKYLKTTERKGSFSVKLK